MAKKLYLKLQTPSVEIVAETTDASGKTESFVVGFKRYDIEELEKRIDTWKDIENMDKILKEEILYFKDVKAEIEDLDTGVITDYIIKDTRNGVEDGLWDTPAEGFNYVLNKMYSSIPYKTAIYNAFNNSITNSIGYREASLGN